MRIEFVLDHILIKSGGRVLSRLLTLAILLITLLWLVVSYLPGVRALLPTIAFTNQNGWMTITSLVTFIAFVAIQIWLVFTTVATVRTYQARNSPAAFRLRIGVEFFWTALPIAMSLLLAWASYTLWFNL